MTLTPTFATEPVYATGSDGVRRLVAAPGDVIPATVPAHGVITRHDPPSSGIEPMEGYDALTEDEVVALLPGMDADTLAAVQAYERTHLARGSIHQYKLTTPVVRGGRRGANTDRTVSQRSVAEGYAGLSDDELAAETERRELTVSATGSAAKVRKARIVALQADDAKSDSGT
jgi:hypothetical protein